MNRGVPVVNDPMATTDSQHEQAAPDVVGLTLPEAREILREWRLSLVLTGVPGAELVQEDAADDEADPPWRVLRQEVPAANTMILTVAPEETLNVKERVD